MVWFDGVFFDGGRLTVDFWWYHWGEGGTQVWDMAWGIGIKCSQPAGWWLYVHELEKWREIRGLQGWVVAIKPKKKKEIKSGMKKTSGQMRMKTSEAYAREKGINIIPNRRKNVSFLLPTMSETLSSPTKAWRLSPTRRRKLKKPLSVEATNKTLD